MKDLCRGLSMLCSQTGKRVSNFIFRDPRLLKEKLFLYVFSTLKLCHSINQPRQDGKKHQGDLIMKIGRLDLPEGIASSSVLCLSTFPEFFRFSNSIYLVCFTLN